MPQILIIAYRTSTKNIFRVDKFGMCANIFLQRFQKITHLPVNTQYPESSVNNKIKGITAEDNKDAKFCLMIRNTKHEEEILLGY